MALFKRKKQEIVRVGRQNIEEQGYAFRRSRTLSGSTSAKVSSANEENSQLKSPRLKAHELHRKRRMIVSGLVGALCGCGVILWLLDQYMVSLNAITTSTPLVRSVNEEAYRKIVTDYLGARPAERFRFLLNSDRFEQYVKSKAPEVERMDLYGGKGFASTAATMQFRAPVIVWQVASSKYYVDKNGQTFEVNYYNDPSVSVKDDSGVPASSGQLIASSRLLGFLGKTIDGVNTSGIGRVTAVTLPPGTVREADLTVEGREYRIKTYLDRDPNSQVYDITNALRYIDAHQIAPRYVDVRVEGKAYYL